MAHEISRVLRAFAAEPWFIEARKAEQIVALLELRAMNGPRAAAYIEQPRGRPPVVEIRDGVAVLRAIGPIVPRAEALDDISQQAMMLNAFTREFAAAAADSDLKGIVLEIDSPGGQVDLLPETVAMIRAARRPERPIVAVANTVATSAAYWLGMGADEIVATPSGKVGSIGAYVLHEDISEALRLAGVRMTFISAGPRKTEGNPFEPLAPEAEAALLANVEHFYGLFVRDVARARNVPESVVRADPETAARHFGGGRTYPAAEAKRLGMIDRVETLDQVVARLQRRRAPRRAALL